MIVETYSILPGFDFGKPVAAPVVKHQPRKKYHMDGSNANHPDTVRMREIKSTLQLTTAQLVKELIAYEREHQSEASRKYDDQLILAWTPITPVLMASYLQGWVVQSSYISVIRGRLENLYEFKMNQGIYEYRFGIRTVMDRWYWDLGIKTNDSSVSPTRQLARMIAPYYRRPVLVSVPGTFYLGPTDTAERYYTIRDSNDELHKFPLNASDPVLITDGTNVKQGDVVQYSILMQGNSIDGDTTSSKTPSIDHTTFYRWYTNNKMPRSINTINLVQDAVDLAVAAQKK